MGRLFFLHVAPSSSHNNRTLRLLSCGTLVDLSLDVLSTCRNSFGRLVLSILGLLLSVCGSLLNRLRCATSKEEDADKGTNESKNRNNGTRNLRHELDSLDRVICGNGRE